jgi:hypothetical protein
VESPLLEAVARKRIVKTLQAEEDLVFAIMICKLRRLAVALYLLVVPRGVYKWPINPFTSPNSVCSHINRDSMYGDEGPFMVVPGVRSLSIPQ